MIHYCVRCGADTECRYSGWADRHPAAAVAGAIAMVPVMTLFAMFVISALAVYPFATLAFSILALLGGAGALKYRRDNRLKAAARRFDWETSRRVM
jgi:hypothetical protein